jgi:hypothetical protein
MEQQDPHDQPALSVVVVTPERFANIRRTVRPLRAQTVQRQIELLLVAPTEEALADHEPHELDGFFRVRMFGVGPVENVDVASAHGLLAAAAPAVATVEDHAFPDAGWAAAHIVAHEGPWAVVGSLMKNANPTSTLSWTNLLIAYGFATEPAPTGEREAVATHNVSFKTAVLQDLGERLFTLIGRGGGLLDELRARGHRFYLAPEARIYHVNPSRLASTADLRFNAGRLYGATRARQEGWSPLKRVLYTVAAPLIPAVRFKRLHADLFGSGQRAGLAPRVYPGLLLGLVFDGLGQMAGYALGPGATTEKLAVFEMDRYQHLTAVDRERLKG